MQKIWFLLVLAFSASVYGDKKKYRNQFMNMVAKCKRTYPHITNERIKSLLRHESSPVSMEEKCAADCLLKEQGLLANGKLDVKEWTELAKANWVDPNIATLVGDAAELCQGKVHDDDSCNEAGKVIDCVFSKLDEMGVPPPDYPK